MLLEHDTRMRSIAMQPTTGTLFNTQYIIIYPTLIWSFVCLAVYLDCWRVYVVPSVSSTMAWHCVVYSPYCISVYYHLCYVCLGFGATEVIYGTQLTAVVWSFVGMHPFFCSKCRSKLARCIHMLGACYLYRCIMRVQSSA